MDTLKQALKHKTIAIREVGLRDGLQNEAPQSIAKRICLGEALLEAGVTFLESCAFTGPKMTSMSDPEAVYFQLSTHPAVMQRGSIISALVMTSRKNLTEYLDKALMAGVYDLAFVLSAHPGHCQRNLGADTDELLARYKTLFTDPRLKNAAIKLRVYVSTAWGDVNATDVSAASVYTLASKLFDMGACEVGLADTSALGTPELIAERFEYLRQHGLPLAQLAFHAHDPDWKQGLGVANILGAVQTGITRVDTSILGLGGCPATAHPHGNVSTEDLVAALHQAGYQTGIDPVALLRAAKYGVQDMGLPIYSQTSQQVWAAKP